MTHGASTFIVGCVGLLAALGVVLFLPTPVIAVDQATIAILKQIAQLGEATGSYRADCKTVIEEDGTTRVMYGHLIAKWPNMSRDEIRSAEDGSLLGIVVKNGQVQWEYVPMINAAFKSNMEALHADAESKYGISAHYVDPNSIQYLEKAKVGTEETYVFEGAPSVLITKRDPNHPAKMKVYISARDGTIRKTTSYDKRGRETFVQVCGNVRKDASIPVEDFEFIPPEGTRVIEVSDVVN